MRFSHRSVAAAGFAALLTAATGGVLALSLASGQASAQAAQVAPGHAIYEEYCGACHNDPEGFMGKMAEFAMSGKMTPGTATDQAPGYTAFFKAIGDRYEPVG